MRLGLSGTLEQPEVNYTLIMGCLVRLITRNQIESLLNCCMGGLLDARVLCKSQQSTTQVSTHTYMDIRE